MFRHLYVAQRLSAVLLAPLVLVHLALIVIAVRNGLTADEVLGRTRGNPFWLVFYSVFVVAVTIHAPLGIRNILLEWTRWSAPTVNVACGLLGLLLAVTGMRAVMAVIG